MVTHYMFGKFSKKHSNGWFIYQSFVNITDVFELSDVLEIMGFPLQIHV